VELGTGYGAYLLHTTLALLAVCALAVLVLWLLRRRAGGASRGLRVVARLALEPRRAVYVIEAAGKFLLVGVGDGPMTTLAELDPARARELESEAGADVGLIDLVRRLLGQGPQGGARP
jgi:flagellar biosynthetic protein FliO